MDYVSYPLERGFVANWLVAGPLAVALEADFTPAWEPLTAIDGAAVEPGPLGTGVFHSGAASGVWAYYRCPEDRRVDHSGHYLQRQFLRSWAYAELVSDTSRSVPCVLTVDGPSGVWLDGTAVFRAPAAGTHAFALQLPNGAARVLVRFERLAQGHTPHTMALRISTDGVHVRIPTLMHDLGRRTAFERLTSDVFMDRDVYEGDTPIVLRWPAGERALCPAHARLHSADDSIYALTDASGEAGLTLELGFAMQLPAGPYHVTLMPSPDEVYLKDLRIFVHLPLWSLGRARYSGLPSGDAASRRTEALLAVVQQSDSVCTQIARMALGAWEDVEPGPLLEACEAVQRGHDGSELGLVILLGMLSRFGAHARFPQQLRRPLEQASLAYGYDAEPPQHRPESGRLLVHTAELLAGQHFPEHTFGDGRTGAWHRTHAERLALEWMAAYGSHGTADWGASDAIARTLVALSHLADLADDRGVYELAAVYTDKLLFTLAVNSRQGVLGSAASRSLPSYVKSGYLQPTAGISRLLWGMGIYNHHVAGVLSLACATGYDAPPILEAIAQDAAAELWSRERHAAPGAEPCEIDTYRTPEYILSSVRGLVPGAGGAAELVWRATLSPAGVVFANHPGSSSESDSRVPGWWAGNARLPRVAQWKDALLSMHRLAADDVFGFTHAYFPSTTFDDFALRDGWAFARGGDGYLALRNSNALSMTSTGRYAGRELSAWGRHQTWLVHLGRAALDGAFSEFQAAVLKLHVSFGDCDVEWTTLRGDVLGLAWDGPFTVNGARQPAHGSKHIENAYTTTELASTLMEIRHGLDYLRLDFA